MAENSANEKISKPKMLLKLFLSTLYISAFTFGGGFVIITLMKKKFVDELHWIDEDEMLDLTALAQSSPGAVAVNASILIGKRVCGFPGMITAVIGTVLPPIITLSVISFFYAEFASNRYVALALKGMQAGVAAVIFDVVCDMGLKILKNKKFTDYFILAAAFTATFFFNVNVIFIILAAAVIGTTGAFINRRREKRK